MTAMGFLDHVREACAEHDVEVVLETACRKDKFVGTFDGENRVLKVTAHEDDWLLTMAHEYGHFLQWKNKHPLWDVADYGTFDEVMAGRKVLSEADLKSLTRAIQKLELGAEKVAVAHMRKWKLASAPLLQRYCRNANEYVWDYEVARRWPHLWSTSRTPLKTPKPDADRFMPSRLMSERRISDPPGAWLRHVESGE